MLAGLTALTIWCIVDPRPAAWWQTRASFGSLLGLTVIAGHAPFLFHRGELPNPDEAQMMSGAITLRQDFAPWRSVDLSTAGPLSVTPLLIAPDSFVYARWCAALCAAGAVLLSYLSLRDHPLTRAGALAASAFFVFMQDLELFQFSSEHFAVLLLATAGCMWFRRGTADPYLAAPVACFVIGLCLGAAVKAKLQSAPCATWLAGAFLVSLLMDRRGPTRQRVAAGGALVAGCLTVPLLFGILAFFQGVLPDMVASYGSNNLHYVGSNRPESSGYQPSVVWGLNYLLKPLGAAILVGLLMLPRFAASERRNTLLALGWLASAIAAVVLPGRGFRHYWFFVLGPLMVAFAFVAIPAATHFLATYPRAAVLSRAGLVLVTLGLVGLPAIHRCTSRREGALRQATAAIHSVKEAGQILRARAKPGDRLTVWGWRPELYVHSGLAQGTRDAVTVWQIAVFSRQAYYIQRFLADLAKNRPRFLADAIGPRGFGYPDRALHGHESLPPLRDLIQRHYDYLGETDGIRLYVRHDE